MIDKNHIKKLSKIEREFYFDKEKNIKRKNLNKATESKKTSFLYGILFVSCGVVGFINPDNAVICLILISSSSIPFILSRSFKKDEKEAKKELDELLKYEKEIYEEEKEIDKEKVSMLDKSNECIETKDIVLSKRQELLSLYKNNIREINRLYDILEHELEYLNPEIEDIETQEKPYQLKRSNRIDKDK